MPIGQQIALPRKLVPVFSGEALYRGAYGGRGSAKSRSFAKMAAVHGLRCAFAKENGVIVCGREFQNSLDESSMAEVKQAIETEPWLAANYEVGEKYIRTKDGRIDFAFVGLRRNIESVKSTARIRLLWVDEAEHISELAWQKAIPTVREENSEIWVTWNPERRASATNQRFRVTPPANSKIVEVNWRDNPWFPTTLEQIRAEDEQKRPDQYEHIWEGDYAHLHPGSYYASPLNEAMREGRISKVQRDPLMAIRCYCDLGGTGARSDAMALVVCQFVGREIRILDYGEAVGQNLAYHIDWLREKGWGKAQIFLPHDGATHDRVYDVSFESAFRSAGFAVEVIPNQGRGAARARIEAARRMFPSIWFNEETTVSMREALGWYHERRSDDQREVGLGPEHDWASHCFHSETEVLTRSGTYQMIGLPASGEVLTRWGWKAYRNPRVTRRNASLVAVTFGDGLTVKCTPDHLFATEQGWISAECLRPGTVIQSSLVRGRSDGKASIIDCGWVRNIWRVDLTRVSAGCIERFGRLLSDLSPRNATFITAITTGSTMRFPIWSACQPASISVRHRAQRTAQSRPVSISATRRVTLPPSGTRAQKAAHGIAGTLQRQRVGSNGSGHLASVFSAAVSLTLSFARALWCRFTASLSASVPHIANRGAAINGLLTIVNVRELSETADVWCLTVPDAEEFSLANGAVVHNCADAFGLMAVAYETPRGRPQPLKYMPMGIV